MTATVLPPIAPVEALPRLDSAAAALAAAPSPQLPASVTPGSFSQLLSNGIESVNKDLLRADKMARAFALDDSIPVHQVTYALEQARLSLALALQVRTRLIDGYQQLMNMQL